jgi:SAM-dependent methyltransferase
MIRLLVQGISRNKGWFMNNTFKLVLLSFVALFLELSLIRWLPAHIFSIGFFSNVVLIGSFLGLGTGFLLVSHRRGFENYFPPLFLATILLALLLGSVKVAIPQNAQIWLWSFYAENRLGGLVPLELTIPQVLTLVYIITMLVFIPLGQRIGRLMQEFEPLRGYAWNVAGSLLGVVVFALLSALGTAAFIWFAVIGTAYLAVTWRERWAIFAAVALAGGVAIVAVVERSSTWSPYYSINTQVNAEEHSLEIFVNQLFHQKAVDFAREPGLESKYSIPYRWFKPGKVLVVGAGSGNDVAIALKNGAGYVDAVEIDPAIQSIGRKHHPQAPYADNRVQVHINDARSFMHGTRERYDMIVFGTLDSHANLSITSSMRLDNYVYTRESLHEALNLLTDRGVVVLLFSVPNQWIFTRLLSTARAAFGENNSWYAAYDGDLFNLMVVGGPGAASLAASEPLFRKELKPVPAIAGTIVPTDDWPYLYLEQNNIPPIYLIVIATLIAISLGAIMVSSPLKHNNLDPLFFFLGCGFLLLETKSVTTLSLLFGSTWLVNAVVFVAILAIATLANLLVLGTRRLQPRLFFAGLAASILVLYFLPLTPLLQLQGGLKILFAGVLVALPIFFSSMVFAHAVRNVANIGLAMGSNLLGAVVGGFCEYLSMIWGLNALYLMALLFYVAAFMFFRKRSVCPA